MKRKQLFLFNLIVWLCLAATCYALDDLQVSGPDNAARVDFQVLEQNKVLVSALDAEGNPIQNLTAKDFVIKKGLKKAEIVDIQSLETSRDIGLNMVLAVDNSFSMKERNAIKPLLTALEHFLNIVRPIDDVHVVTFDDRYAMRFKNTKVNVKVYRSNKVEGLREHFKNSYDLELSNRTFLYDGMIVGLDILQKMPERQNKFLIAFSDGEDLNSIMNRKDVQAAAKGIANLAVYSVDYMPVPEPDRFLKAFSEDNKGRLWKASSADELVPIFKKFSTTLFDRYVITYRFLNPPKGSLSVQPAEIKLNILSTLDGSPLPYYIFFETGKSDLSEKYRLLKDAGETGQFNQSLLTTPQERYRNVLNLVGMRLKANPSDRIKIVGCNSDSGMEKNAVELSQKRAESVRDYLTKIWAVEALRVKMEKRNLPVRPSPLDVLGGRAENQRVEISFETGEPMGIVDDFVACEDSCVLTLAPQVNAEYGMASWKMDIGSGSTVLKSLQGMKEIAPSYQVGVGELGLGRIAALQNLTASLKAVDSTGDVYQTSTVPFPVTISKTAIIHEFVRPPYGSVSLAPERITIEEITTVDSSPLLNHVYFATGSGSLPDHYVRLKDGAGAAKFQESNLKGPLDKYYQVLNVIGKRLAGNPDSTIVLDGCVSDVGVEKNAPKLSQARAEAVQSYLKDIWGIDPSRVKINARKLPAVASSSRVEEGRVENQRAEFHTGVPGVLDPVKSTFMDAVSDTKQIEVTPGVQAGYGMSEWHLDLLGDGKIISSKEGKGDPPSPVVFDVGVIGLQKLSSFSNLTARMKVKDEKGQEYETVSGSCPVKFIKREEQLAQRAGYKVVERYALILFDFDRYDIKEHNLSVLQKIVDRIKQMPAGKVKITGHTDTIGTPDYNLKLSEKRARAVYDKILASGIPASENISWQGLGQNEPLYDNGKPEGRALNRTVTITIEYESREKS